MQSSPYLSIYKKLALTWQESIFSLGPRCNERDLPSRYLAFTSDTDSDINSSALATRFPIPLAADIKCEYCHWLFRLQNTSATKPRRLPEGTKKGLVTAISNEKAKDNYGIKLSITSDQQRALDILNSLYGPALRIQRERHGEFYHDIFFRTNKAPWHIITSSIFSLIGYPFEILYVQANEYTPFSKLGSDSNSLITQYVDMASYFLEGLQGNQIPAPDSKNRQHVLGFMHENTFYGRPIIQSASLERVIDAIPFEIIGMIDRYPPSFSTVFNARNYSINSIKKLYRIITRSLLRAGVHRLPHNDAYVQRVIEVIHIVFTSIIDNEDKNKALDTLLCEIGTSEIKKLINKLAILCSPRNLERAMAASTLNHQLISMFDSRSKFWQQCIKLGIRYDYQNNTEFVTLNGDNKNLDPIFVSQNAEFRKHLSVIIPKIFNNVILEYQKMLGRDQAPEQEECLNKAIFATFNDSKNIQLLLTSLRKDDESVALLFNFDTEDNYLSEELEFQELFERIVSKTTNYLSNIDERRLIARYLSKSTFIRNVFLTWVDFRVLNVKSRLTSTSSTSIEKTLKKYEMELADIVVSIVNEGDRTTDDIRSMLRQDDRYLSLCISLEIATLPRITLFELGGLLTYQEFFSGDAVSPHTIAKRLLDTIYCINAIKKCRKQITNAELVENI